MVDVNEIILKSLCAMLWSLTKVKKKVVVKGDKCEWRRWVVWMKEIDIDEREVCRWKRCM